MKTQVIHQVAHGVAKSALLFMAIATLAACGSSNKSSSQPGTGDDPKVPTSTVGNAECNQFSGTSLAGKATTYYWNGTLDQDKLRLRITDIPAAFETSSTMTIQFFRWKATSKGVTTLDSTPLTFTVEKGTSGAYPISGVMSEIDKDDIDALRSSGGVSGSTARSFFQNTVLVLSGTNYDWDALKVVVYDGTNPVAEADFLLPVFSADPNKYAANHPPVLEQLHPFWADRKEKNSQTEWESRSDAFCF